MQSSYIYGPVPSRRLGFSLGIDVVPFKTCCFDCIYCQLGKTTDKTIDRKEYTPVQEILKDISGVLKKNDPIDYIAFSGSGEPTLHSRIGYLINEIKKMTNTPVAVFTNSSLLFINEVRKQISKADLVLPTLCTISQNLFQQINRSHPMITIEKIIQGLIAFRKSYRGKIWLEVMLVRKINDTPEEITKLVNTVKEINPDKIHLNTVVRPPSDICAAPLTVSELNKIKSMMGMNCDIIAEFKSKKERSQFSMVEQTILNIIKRRPVTIDDIICITGFHKSEILKHIDHLKRDKKIKAAVHDEKEYYEAIYR